MLITAGFRISIVVHKSVLTHDDSISYLAATCHEGDLVSRLQSGDAPFNQWVPASAWKEFLSIKSSGCFISISYDLGHYDMHPPLYFWVLHFWLLIFGVGITTGVWLNVLTAVLTCLGIWYLARQIFDDGRYAGIAAVIWAVSAGPLAATLESRPYELLALVTVIYAIQMGRIVDSKRNSLFQFIFLFLTLVAGLLTHYIFVLIVVPASWFMLLFSVKRLRRILLYSGVLCVSLLSAYLLHQNFWYSFVGQSQRMLTLSGGVLVEKMWQTLQTLGQFFGVYPFNIAVGIMVLGVIIFFIVLDWRQGQRYAHSHSRQKAVLFFYYCCSLVILRHIFCFGRTCRQST